MPNLANPNNSPPPAPGEENRQPGIIVTTIIVTVLADIFVGLRLIVRKWVTKSIGWDDWTIIAAAVSRHSLLSSSQADIRVLIAGYYHRVRPGRCGGSLRLRTTQDRSYKTGIYRLYEILLRRVDPNIRDPHVYKGLHLLVPPQNRDQQDIHSVPTTLDWSSGSEQHHLDYPMDCSVPARVALLGQP